mgnify:CR=1 FL=1
MTTLEEVLEAVRGMEAALNRHHSEDKQLFSRLLEGQRRLYQFWGIPTDEEQQPAELPVNLIFKKFHHGRPINFRVMRDMLATNFVIHIHFAYEWFALWKVLLELQLLENTKLSDFSRQMFYWFPDAPKMCKADSMGDYRSGYLGNTPSTLWNEKQYLVNLKGNQSQNAFRHIALWNENLKELLKNILVKSHEG